MYYTQNEKILQVGEENLIVGIDVGSSKHYARAFDWRGIEYSKKAFAFTNDAEGYANFLDRITKILEKSGKETVLLKDLINAQLSRVLSHFMNILRLRSNGNERF